MKRISKNVDMKLASYNSPESMILDIKSEGVLCFSQTSSSAEDFTIGDGLTDSDYEQIY